MQRKTVVLVCMVDSIHVARWIAQFDPTEVRFVLFPSGPNRRVHPKILEMIAKGKKFDDQITIVPFGGKLSLPLWVLDRFFGDRIRGFLLGRIIRKTNPDFVHALEFQHAGYITMRALADKSITTPFIATNYGSDIFWFQRFPRHKRRIQQILNRADFYSCECDRDVELAKQLGYTGNVLPVLPNSGGIDFNTLPNPKPFQQRRIIAVKGYDGWVGRARWALLALEALKDEIDGFEIVVFSADRVATRLARQIKRRTGLNIRIHNKGALSHEEMMGLFAASRIYVGVSLSDGLSTSMLEAIANGCFAVQTSTACTTKFLSEGVNGLTISELSPDGVLSSLKQALRYLRNADFSSESGFDNAGFRLKTSRDYIEQMSRQFFYTHAKE